MLAVFCNIWWVLTVRAAVLLVCVCVCVCIICSVHKKAKKMNKILQKI